MVKHESEKDDDSWSRDGCGDELLAHHRSELELCLSLVLVVGIAEPYQEVEQLRRAVLLEESAW